MKVRKPISIHIPDGAFTRLCGLADQVKQKRYNMDYLLYIIYRVVYAQHFDNRKKNKKEVYGNINVQKIAELTNSKTKRYISFLEKGNIIECDNYIPGVKSKHYRINPELLGSWCRVSLSGKLVDSLMEAKKRDNKRISVLDQHLKVMYNNYKKIDFDYDGMLDYAMANYTDAKLLYALNSIEQLNDKRFRRFTISRTNKRLNTNLTNLPKELRRFIVGDFVEIDAKNSQFYLLATIIEAGSNGQTHSNGICWPFLLSDSLLSYVFKRFERFSKMLPFHQKRKKGSIYDFLKLTQKGEFYEAILTRMNLAPDDRDRIKKMSLAAVYSANREDNGQVFYGDMKKMLSLTFPIVYELIYKVKQRHYKRLSVAMQRLESYLFIQRISKTLVERNITVFTVHDSVIVPAERADEVKILMEEIFEKELGHKPSFDVKHL